MLIFTKQFLDTVSFLLCSLSLYRYVVQQESCFNGSFKNFVLIRKLEMKTNHIYLYLTQDMADWNNLKIKGKVILTFFSGNHNL